MNHTFINSDVLHEFSADSFIRAIAFPWYDFHQFLTPEGFQKLSQDFPSLDFFEKHDGIERIYGQRPHNRYYLAYEKTIYSQFKRQPGKGIIKHADLPISWQMFIEELEASEDYRNFIKVLFEVSDFQVRYAWHMGVTQSEVSPHLDAPDKIGTHIFYFNTSHDWDERWGGGSPGTRWQIIRSNESGFYRIHDCHSQSAR